MEAMGTRRSTRLSGTGVNDGMTEQRPAMPDQDEVYVEAYRYNYPSLMSPLGSWCTLRADEVLSISLMATLVD